MVPATAAPPDLIKVRLESVIKDLYFLNDNIDVVVIPLEDSEQEKFNPIWAVIPPHIADASLNY